MRKIKKNILLLNSIVVICLSSSIYIYIVATYFCVLALCHTFMFFINGSILYTKTHSYI